MQSCIFHAVHLCSATLTFSCTVRSPFKGRPFDSFSIAWLAWTFCVSFFDNLPSFRPCQCSSKTGQQSTAAKNRRPTKLNLLSRDGGSRSNKFWTTHSTKAAVWTHQASLCVDGTERQPPFSLKKLELSVRADLPSSFLFSQWLVAFSVR